MCLSEVETKYLLIFITLLLSKMSSERMSVIKKKGGGGGGQFQNMYLAVFPYQVEFLKNVDHRTSFYFEKKYQVIGSLTRPLPPSRKGQKVSTRALQNILHFRLWSQANVLYQWSAYIIHENGQEEFKDSCTINLKEIVLNYIVPQKSSASRSVQSLISLRLGTHELKLKFAKLGVILSIAFSLSDDPKAIEEQIIQKYFNENQISLPQPPMIKKDSFERSHRLSKRSDSKSRSQQLFSSLKLLQNDSKQLIQPHQKSQAKVDVLDLDNLILTEDVAPTVQQQRGEEFYQLQAKLNQQRLKKSTPEPKFVSKMEQIQNQISSGILKLQSDQVGKEEVDQKLELEELEVIQQQNRSNKETVNDTIAPRFRDKKRHNFSTPIKNSIKPAQQEGNSTISESKFSIKKIIALILFLLLVGLITAKISRQGKRNSKKK